MPPQRHLQQQQQQQHQCGQQHQIVTLGCGGVVWKKILLAQLQTQLYVQCSTATHTQASECSPCCLHPSSKQTLVQWIQSHSTYVDMRVPKELVQTPQGDPSQATTAAGAADSAQPAVSAAAAQKSFAGRSTITTDDVCTWHRHIDFHPPTGGKDIGRNTFSKDGKELVEVG